MMMTMKMSNRIALATRRVGVVVVLVLLMMITTPLHPPAASASRSPPIALAGCSDSCGNISIPYPFGIEPNCFLNSWFRVICNSTSGPLLGGLNWTSGADRSIKFARPVAIKHIDTVATALPSSTSPVLSLSVSGSMFGNIGLDFRKLTDYKHLDMSGSPFLLMPLLNSLVAVGCGASAGLGNRQSQMVVGCSTFCHDNSTGFDSNKAVADVNCYGMSCCQTSVPTSLDYFQMEFRSQKSSNHSKALTLFAVVETSYLTRMPSSNLTFLDYFYDSPTMLQWKLQHLPSDVPNRTSVLCSHTDEGGHYCRCKSDYYQGNPYLPQGCQVIEECERCPDTCVLKVPESVYGCPILDADNKKSVVPIAVGLGISLGSLCLFIVLYGLYHIIKRRRAIIQKQNNFKKNGGLLLNQQMSAGEGTIERTKLFTSSELKKATDNFNENRILGRGGQGTVYKGMLVDGTIVAIKKSKKVNENQLGQFINEVVILSQVNHRNVVKLFGCCLETEVPLLVYEFVLNGTLYHRIHNPSEDFRITWKMRLQIASECADAIAYLHSSSSTPIYHRDIKTSNILLDEKYRAKVADFGTSKTLSVDQTHVTTCVQGTFGYIDPEFFQSNQFTEKSDVYSFGMVLLELLSSKKPINADKSMESRSLASEFLLLMQNSRLYAIVDAEVVKEARKEELEGVADIAYQCLQLNGKQRPMMKEVAMKLQMINSQNRVHDPSPQQTFKQKEVFFADEIHVGDGPPLSNPSISSSNYPSIQNQPLLYRNDFD